MDKTETAEKSTDTGASNGMKIFILLGHSDKDTYSGALADSYGEGAREAGHEVRRIDLGDITFDPILHKGYKEIQELEPGLIAIQENIIWSDHLVIVYPNWWNTMPALLKGMFDRMFLPNYAFHIDKKTKKVDQLLAGRSARVIIVSGTYHPFFIRLKFGDFTNEIERGILKFSGFSPVRVTTLGPIEHCSDTKREKEKKRVYNLGKRGV